MWQQGGYSVPVLLVPLLRAGKALFARYRVRYNIVEASDNPSVLTKKFGDASVPWTVVDGVAVAGYDEPRLKQLLCLK